MGEWRLFDRQFEILEKSMKTKGNTMRFSGRVALVTGAARGQGASHCKHLASEGAQIIAVDICENIPPFYALGTELQLKETVEECRKFGVGALGLVADVRRPEQVKDAVDLAMREFGQIDILCNNSGVARIDAIDEMTSDVLDGIIDVNVKGTFYSTQYVIPGMKERSYGKIINIASAAAVQPLPYLSHYSASKGAIVAATKSWAKELGPWGINVNCIAPGTILTEMIVGLALQLEKDPQTAFDEFNAASAFVGERSHITVDDISRTVAFLASDDSRMITGQVITIDGGKTS